MKNSDELDKILKEIKNRQNNEPTNYPNDNQITNDNSDREETIKIEFGDENSSNSSNSEADETQITFAPLPEAPPQNIAEEDVYKNVFSNTENEVPEELSKPFASEGETTDGQEYPEEEMEAPDNKKKIIAIVVAVVVAIAVAVGVYVALSKDKKEEPTTTEPTTVTTTGCARNY